MVMFRQQLYDALIDSGSELSFTNADVTRHAEALGYRIHDQLNTVHLTNNSPTEVPGAIRIPIAVGKRFTHRFLVMPSLKIPMLIGVDLWAKIGITLRPPPPPRNQIGQGLDTEAYSMELSPRRPMRGVD